MHNVFERHTTSKINVFRSSFVGDMATGFSLLVPPSLLRPGPYNANNAATLYSPLTHTNTHSEIHKQNTFTHKLSTNILNFTWRDLFQSFTLILLVLNNKLRKIIVTTTQLLWNLSSYLHIYLLIFRQPTCHCSQLRLNWHRKLEFAIQVL